MGRQGKETVVKDLAEILRTAETAIITDYRGLKVEEVSNLRMRLREAGAQYLVVKNTLSRLAAKESERENLNQFLVGPTALALASGDPTILARVLANFSERHQAMEIKGGFFGGEVLSRDQLRLWATLPSKEDLLAKVAANIKSPLSNLVNVLRGMITNLIYVLQAVKKDKG
ncbi:50S ribosomal protein L10 [bacterium]|nr:50S ribosomal protein L10 [bacterium]